MQNPRLEYLRDKAKNLPLDPGVYIMRDAGGKIIYIGKAKALRNRVSSYFRSVDKHHPKVYRMVQNAREFDYIVTGSEFEALVLECSMIKQHQPRYNILLKDDKGYRYIRVTREPFPRISVALQKLGDGADYLGPYTSGFVVKQTVEEVLEAFRLPTCRRKFPQDFRKGRPCLNYHIQRCMGVCTGKIRQGDYQETIAQALEYIKGGSGSTIASLQQKMEEAAEGMEFEKAARYRDRIRGISKLREKQSVVFARVLNQDVLSVVQSGDDSSAVVLKFREQRLVDKEDFSLGEISDLPTARRDFILSYYNRRMDDIPGQISMDGECEDMELVERYLGERRGTRVSLHIPARGEQLRMVKMATANAAENLSQKTHRTAKEVAALDELARLLGMPSPPEYIEAYDISNLGSETVVGGMVVFENGRPQKSAYRTFNIKWVEGTDDYASMREVLYRRLGRYAEEKETGEGFGRLPDLILLDGGKGHVSAVRPLLEQFGLDIPLFGMVKDQKHRTRAIARDGGEIAISASRSAFALVTRIQDEVHRFSVAHMTSKHRKTSFELKITAVPGIGQKRARELYRHFKTHKALKAASVEELTAAPGMNRKAAQALFDCYHGDPPEMGTDPAVE